MAKLVGRSINLGQRFEATQNSRDPSKVRPILDAMKREGFQAVRIPITFWADTPETCQLNNATFMGQVDNAINYAVSIGLIVMINCHHEHWLYDTYTGTQEQNSMVWKHWKALAARYRHIPQNKLIFQTINEPQGKAFGSSAHGFDPNDPRRIELTRLINKCSYDGIRAFEKENNLQPTRIVAVTVNNMGNCYKCNTVYPSAADLPGGGSSKYMVLTVHSYDDFRFCGQDGNVSFYTGSPNAVSELRNDIDKRLQMLTDWQQRIGTEIGIIISEYGVGRRTTSDLNHDLIREYFRYTARRAVERGFGTFAWTDSGTGSSWFALFKQDSTTGQVTWLYSLKDAIMNK